MKRLLTLALLAMIGLHANGATISWGVPKSYFGTTGLSGNATGYLIYLGSAGTTWDTTTVDYKTIADGTSENYLATKASSLGKVSGSQNVTEDVTPVYTGATQKITDGDSVFGIMLTYVSEGTTYYHLGGTYLFDTTDTGHYSSGTKTFTWTDSAIASSASGPAAQGWTAVPEPSTAALALAGLALLLKRRKA